MKKRSEKKGRERERFIKGLRKGVFWRQRIINRKNWGMNGFCIIPQII